MSPGFFQTYSINLAFFLGGDLEKNPGLQDLKFFLGLKQTFISQDFDFQKSRCRLKGRLSGHVGANQTICKTFGQKNHTNPGQNSKRSQFLSITKKSKDHPTGKSFLNSFQMARGGHIWNKYS